jgi:hypothetical protein
MIVIHLAHQLQILEILPASIQPLIIHLSGNMASYHLIPQTWLSNLSVLTAISYPFNVPLLVPITLLKHMKGKEYYEILGGVDEEQLERMEEQLEGVLNGAYNVRFEFYVVTLTSTGRP